MFNRVFAAVLVLLAFVFIAPTQGQTVDEIVAKYVAATGGIEKWKALQSLAISSRSPLLSSQVFWKTPNRVRIDVPVDYPTRSIDIRGFDGNTGWRIPAMEGSEVPRLMSLNEIAELQEQGDWLRELIDYKTKGNKIDLVGKTLEDGKPAYKLKLTSSTGAVTYVFLDATSYLEVKRSKQHRSPEADTVVEIVTTLSDYRSVGGLMLPHRVGDAVREYQVNQRMDDAGFKMPEKQTAQQTAGSRIEISRSSNPQ